MELYIRETTLRVEVTRTELESLLRPSDASSSPMKSIHNEVRGPRGFTFLVMSLKNESVSSKDDR